MDLNVQTLFLPTHSKITKNIKKTNFYKIGLEESIHF